MRLQLSLLVLVSSFGLAGSAIAQIGGNSVLIDGTEVGDYLLFEVDNDEQDVAIPNNGSISIAISGPGDLIKESPLISGGFGVTELVFTEFVFNALPTDITAYHMELGWIIGGVFQSSTPGDGLDFDWWLPGDPFACLGVIPPLSVAGPCETPPPGDGNGYLSTVDNTSSEDDLWFLGLLPPNEQANLQFALDIPPLSNVPQGATRWAIRQVAIPIPEPGTLGLLAPGLGFLVLRRRRS